MSRKRCVIVGSGAAGLTAGTLLAREGLDVTVLEQHQVPGGLMHMFRRMFRLLPTGVHNIGCLDPHEILWRYLNYLDVYRHLQLRRMSEACVIQMQFPQFTFRMPGNYTAYRQQLLDMFPSEAPAIHAWIDEMQASVQHFPLYQCRESHEETLPRSLMIAVNERLKQLQASPQLHAALTGHNLLWGVESAQCPLYIHYLVTDTLMRGAYRVADDGVSMGDAFAQAFADAGGQLHCGHEVDHIEVEDRQVQAVHANGQCFPADIVIYTGHVRLLPELCSPGAFRTSYRTRLNDLEDTLGSFGVCLQWDHPTCPADDQDLFLHQQMDTDAPYRHRLFNTDQIPQCVYASGHPHPPSGGHTVTLLTPMHAEEVAAWADRKRARRGDTYEAHKTDVAQRMVRVIEQRWPEVRGRLKTLATFTPLTIQHYTRSPQGSAYGVKRKSGSLLASRVGPKTRVQGLWLAGQNVVLSGILGAVISGVQAAKLATGDRTLVRKIAEATENNTVG